MLRILFFVIGFCLASTLSAHACEVDRPIIFGGLDWDSNAFHTEVARVILEEGYGCETDVIPGSTLPLLTGLVRGDVDVLMEVWRDTVADVWTDALGKGQVVDLGVNFPDAVQGWFVPRYLVEGEGALAPDLVHVRDLPRYKHLFTDPEEPDKGRFYNCILGWTCEVQNTAKLEGYGLVPHFTNFRPGTGGALAAAIASAYTQGKPIVTYYWGPTWVLGSYDMVMLEEAPYTKEAWDAFEADPAGNPPVAFPLVEVVVGANAEFATAAPDVVAFLRAYETSGAQVSAALAFLQESDGATARDAALHFLRGQPDAWRDWVPGDVRQRVLASLNGSASKADEAPWLRVPLDAWVNDGVTTFVARYGSAFDAISTVMLAAILAVENIFVALPWWLVILLVAGLGYHATRGVIAPLGFAGALVLVEVLGHWSLAMQTLALTFVSVIIAALIGLPAGIGLARSSTLRRVALPVLDAMQTLPSFVYLVPALMLFGLGKVPAVFATVIYATPPLIRLTDLGIRLVGDQFREVADDLGARPLQRLIDIELPLALPNIMAGINQTIMMALSMVVIASMIGARGLGEEVLLGIQRLDVGRGLTAGIAIVALAVVFDRVTQAYGRADVKRPPPTRLLRFVRKFWASNA